MQTQDKVAHFRRVAVTQQEKLAPIADRIPCGSSDGTRGKMGPAYEVLRRSPRSSSPPTTRTSTGDPAACGGRKVHSGIARHGASSNDRRAIHSRAPSTTHRQGSRFGRALRGRREKGDLSEPAVDSSYHGPKAATARYVCVTHKYHL